MAIPRHHDVHLAKMTVSYKGRSRWATTAVCEYHEITPSSHDGLRGRTGNATDAGAVSTRPRGRRTTPLAMLRGVDGANYNGPGSTSSPYWGQWFAKRDPPLWGWGHVSERTRRTLGGAPGRRVSIGCSAREISWAQLCGEKELSSADELYSSARRPPQRPWARVLPVRPRALQKSRAGFTAGRLGADRTAAYVVVTEGPVLQRTPWP